MTPSIRRPRTFALLLLGWLAALPECTGAMWSSALKPVVEMPHVQGLVPPLLYLSTGSGC